MSNSPARRLPLSSAVVLTILAGLAVAAVIAFMTIGARGSWSFVFTFRGLKLAALLLVAFAIAVSTVMFQTITNNRILTPSIMGFDSLYVLLQSVLVFLLGSTTVSAIDARLMFCAEIVVMACFSIILYRFLFSGSVRGLHLLMLIGIVFGVLFRSLAGFLQRIMDPNEFVVLQDRLFASFNTADASLLGVSTLLIGCVCLAAWRIFHVFDVMSLGRDSAIVLGVDHQRITLVLLIMVTVLVSVSTALVGPVTFFGLLVANLAYLLVPSGKHRHILPAAALVAIICLVGGQTIMERVLAFDTALSIVIEFAGGIFFILFILKGAAR